MNQPPKLESPEGTEARAPPMRIQEDIKGREAVMKAGRGVSACPQNDTSPDIKMSQQSADACLPSPQLMMNSPSQDSISLFWNYLWDAELT